MMSLSCRIALVGKRRILNLPLLPGDRVGSNGGGGGHRGKRRHRLGGRQPRPRRPRLRCGRHFVQSRVPHVSTVLILTLFHILFTISFRLGLFSKFAFCLLARGQAVQVETILTDNAKPRNFDYQRMGRSCPCQKSMANSEDNNCAPLSN